MVNRLFVEKKDGAPAAGLSKELGNMFGFEPKSCRKLLRYDVEGLSEELLNRAATTIFSEPPVDYLYKTAPELSGKVLIVEYLDGQYDQRADSAMQCAQLLSGGVRPIVRCATVYAFEGVTNEQFAKIKGYLINPVDSREGSDAIPETLKRDEAPKTAMRVTVEGFNEMDETALKAYFDGFGFAMTFKDLLFVQNYFRSVKREPTYTELKVVDTYWSDHCRHTTFATELKNVEIHSENPHIAETFEKYKTLFADLYKNRDDKYVCLMDLATIAVKELKRKGYLDNLDQSDEINACSVVVPVDCDGRVEDWLIMFKNETHNHPTEIEPFGGAATCLGGAIRDPLSGRTYVYQAMRVTGAGNPLVPISETLKGKLPQRVLTKTALNGFSSYGNQIGLATGEVKEYYHDRYRAKRLETGYVIAGAPRENVVRRKPQAGDVVILLGGDTGRDGCGGATGSSKSHNAHSVELCGAEVQKGNAPEERKLQRLFRNKEAAQLIVKCNDFGAGGVSVAIGELADGIDIYLDRIRKKYEGLTATELAISESQERMAVVVPKEKAEEMKKLAAVENLNATEVAVITDSGRLRMFYGDESIVDIERSFLDTNGVKQTASAIIADRKTDYFTSIDEQISAALRAGDFETALKTELSDLNVCSQKGAGETFDSTIGRGTVLMPFGGKNQLTPSTVMASKPPVNGYTTTVTCSSHAFYPYLTEQSPYIGAVYSVLAAAAKLVSAGVPLSSVRLSLQEFFKRLNDSPERWGEPLSALLGALEAELSLKLAAIGGKDSMSGSYENLDVPPTVIAFAMGVTKEHNVRHNAFGADGYVYEVELSRDEYGMPDFGKVLAQFAAVEKMISSGLVKNTAVVENCGRLATLAKSLIGNETGAILSEEISAKDFCKNIGNILIVTAEPLPDRKLYATLSKKPYIVSGETKIAVSALKDVFTATLEPVFPTTAPASGEVRSASFFTMNKFKSAVSVAKPRVFIPVFPGTNCELDTAAAVKAAGGEADIFVLKNLTPKDIENSINEMAKRINNAQIIAFPGGFSGGDEPDGSGKFIATTFMNPALRDAVENLLYKRDGLAIGICNGFQALIKLGLLPDGHVVGQQPDSATLTFNNIRRHVSTIARVRVATNNSPWLSLTKVGDIYAVPVSHGEGRFTATDEKLSDMLRHGQIATQYVDKFGVPTMESPCNPNGSLNAIEGIISPDGRVLGKMGHTERWQAGLYKNIEGECFEMPLFLSGIKYFG